MSRKTKQSPVCHLSGDEYRALDAVNWSTLKYACQSPLAYQHALANPPVETDAMRLGRATHTAVFEPDRLLHEYVIWSGGRRAGKEWDEFKAMHENRTILKPDEYDTAIAIRNAVRGHKAAAKLLKTGEAECTLQWTDQDTGIACKARLDWYSPKVLVDLKTTRDIEARAFGRHAGALMYHGQFAFYAMGLYAHGVEVPVKIIAVESEAPHDVAVYDLNEDVLWAGEVKVRQALAVVKACRKTRKWPGRYPNECGLMLPTWEFPNDDEEEALTRAVGDGY